LLDISDIIAIDISDIIAIDISDIIAMGDATAMATPSAIRDPKHGAGIVAICIATTDSCTVGT
jgi:hypothetical protein